MGRRSALVASTTIISFLLSGWLLNELPFTWGYMAVFGLGALGSALSTYHLARINPPALPSLGDRPLGDMAQPTPSIISSGGIP